MEWVVLTRGKRPDELNTAVASLSRKPTLPFVLVIGTGTGQVSTPGRRLRIVEFADNLGVPGGRDRGVQESSAKIVGFLDDDAVFAAIRPVSSASSPKIRDSALSPYGWSTRKQTALAGTRRVWVGATRPNPEKSRISSVEPARFAARPTSRSAATSRTGSADTRRSS